MAGFDPANPRGPDQRVAPPRHRRLPGMRLLTGYRDLVPALALGAGDEADWLARHFEDRALVDMRLEIGGDWPAADRLQAGEADPLELGAELDVGQVVQPCQTLGEIKDAGEHPRADHRRREARALLVGPSNDLDRSLGLVAEVVQGAHEFESGHHAIGAVELAAGRLGVEMAAGHDRRQARVAAGTARKDVADLVDRDSGSGFFAPANEKPVRSVVEVARSGENSNEPGCAPIQPFVSAPAACRF